MRIPRVHAPKALVSGESIELPADSARHLLRVLRLGSGALIHVFDGEGQEFAGTIVNDKLPLCIKLGEQRWPATESPLQITLAQAVAKGERMDYALQKAVELGVDAIQPLITERTIVRLDGARLDKRHAHWLGVIASACEQSGRTRLPALRPGRTLAQWLDGLEPTDFDAAWLLDPLAQHSLAAAAKAAPVRRGLLLIGPEGGLSPLEIESAQHHGLQPVRLGPRVLRTETAATVALSVLQSCCGDLG